MTFMLSLGPKYWRLLDEGCAVDRTSATEEVRTEDEVVPEYGPHPAPRHCGCADRLTNLEQGIVGLHRLYRAGEICESTYRRTLQQLEAEVAVLSRAF